MFINNKASFALLQTFEVTARHLSLTLAAACGEMNLTQGAVSHRIRRLEMQYRVSPVYPHDA